MDKKNIVGWEEVLKNNPPSYEQYFKDEKSYLISNIKKNAIVLEIGCGNGRTLKELISVTSNLTGVDHDELAVKDAKDNLKNIVGAKIILADGKNLPFNDSVFDIVLCMLTFANLDDGKYKILNEMKRVLKPDGNIFISVYSEDALEERLKAYKQANLNIKEIKSDGTVVFDDFGIDGVSEQFSKKELEAIFKKAKLKSLEIKKSSIAYICKLT